LAEGGATVRIRATTSGGGAPRTLDYSYTFTVAGERFGSIEGNVVNCLNNEPIAGAIIEPTDPDLPAVISSSNGTFTIADFPFGSFVLSATADGFIDSSLSGTLAPQQPIETITVALCPRTGSTTGMRVVLTWGAEPPASMDLDAHLRGPVPSAGALVPDDFHVDFTNTNIVFATGGSATLDIDSTMFAGPETETVDTLIPGRYRYCVHNFSDRDLSQSRGLINSGVSVRLFIGDEQRGEFLVPDVPGNTWAVFEVDTLSSTPVVNAIGTVVDQADRRKVCASPSDSDGDGLSGAQEAQIGTDPDNYDTNSNGVSDGQDIINGDSPLPPTP
jgi:hypothetical protein